MYQKYFILQTCIPKLISLTYVKTINSTISSLLYRLDCIKNYFSFLQILTAQFISFTYIKKWFMISLSLLLLRYIKSISFYWLLLLNLFHLHTTKLWHLYYQFTNRAIGLMSRVFANGPQDQGSIRGQVIPKTQQMVLDATLLNTQHYKVRIKGKVEQSRERSSALPYTLV